MTERVLLSHIRERIGAPNKTDISDDRLRGYVVDAAERLAEELESFVRTDETAIALEANVQEYPLPPDILTVLWVEHNNMRLEPVGINELDSGRTNWRNESAGTPRRYAIQGRNLILLPKPSSGAVSDDAILSLRYIASAPEISASGPLTWSEADQWTLIYLAALTFCQVNPSPENQARVPAYTAQVMGRLAEARRRWENTTRFHHPRFRPETSGRFGAAR